MASHQCKTLVLLCLLVAWNLSIAEARENADLDDVEDAGEQEDADEEEHEHDDVSLSEDEEEKEEGDEDEDDVAFVDETDVVVLGSNNFTTFMASQRAVFLQVHAPWCLHCAKLAPQWAAAATALKNQVIFARLDASEPPEELHVHRFPTLLFFLDGVHSSYNGDLSKDAIVKYVTVKMSRSVKALMSVSDAESLLAVQSPIAIAYLKKLKGPPVYELTVAARQQEDVAFYMTSNADVASRLGFGRKTKPVLAVIRNVPEEHSFFKGPFKRKALNDFVSANKLPLVIFYNRETASLFLENAIQKQVLCFVRDDEYWGYAQPLFEEVARAFRGQALFVRVTVNDQIGSQVAEFYGVTGENPIVIMAVIVGEDGPKYLYEGEFTIEGIKGFVEGFMKNNLQPYYKSEPRPPPSTEDVKTAVGKSFDEVVLDEAKDTLLELYSPWCHHCEELEPIYKKLAKALKGIPSISIVKMDGLANEHPRAKVDGFPTILFYPANKKRFEPIKFDGDTSMKSLYHFLKKHASIPFSLPKHAPKPTNPKLNDEL